MLPIFKLICIGFTIYNSQNEPQPVPIEYDDTPVIILPSPDPFLLDDNVLELVDETPLEYSIKK